MKNLMNYWSVLLDAFLDTLKILPILFIVYYLIELIEFKYAEKLQNNKFLKGKASPVFGALLGSIPQCGFSVVLTDLYSRGALAVGCLVAVYLATSDEAIPILIAHPNKILSILLIIVIKLLVAILVGYLAAGLYKLIFKKQAVVVGAKDNEILHVKNDHDENDLHDEFDEHNEISFDKTQTENAKNKCLTIHDGCCHHHVETKSFDWMHPLLHCLKISAFILLVNFVFGCFTDIWVGRASLMEFLNANKYLQPLLSVLIGFIPNCASSVVLTQLFIEGGLRFGALLSGLCMNAGLGLIFLLKLNKNVKENIFIFLVIVFASLLVGYGLIWVTL